MKKDDGFSVSEDSAITIPIRNLVAMIFATGVVVMGYFELTERISILERELHLAETYIAQNNEFRIRWPRGELGSLPDDMMQNAALETLQGEVDANTEFRTTWKPPIEVQESVRKNNEQEIRIGYLDNRIENLEKALDRFNTISSQVTRQEVDISTQEEKIETLFELWNTQATRASKGGD